MKKLFAVALALAMLLTATAFAEAADFVGIWYLNEVTMEGASIAPATLGVEMTMELKEDGTAVLATAQSEDTEAQEGTWSVAGQEVTVTVEDDPMVFAYDGENLTVDDNGLGMTFGREKVEAELFEPAAAKADAAVEDYAGTWSAFKIDLDGTWLDTALLGEDITAAIDGTTITLNGFLFSDEAYETAFADGALSFSVEDDEALVAGVSAQLLEDDTLALTVSAGSDLVLIMSRVEAE